MLEIASAAGITRPLQQDRLFAEIAGPGDALMPRPAIDLVLMTTATTTNSKGGKHA
jgi:hypothetical protein